MPEAPERVEVTELSTIRALAHPRRQRMLQHLALNGPLTSAGLARALDLNTGATSYHLRELAHLGLVEEVPELGRGRERWWRAPRRDFRLPPRSAQDPALRAVLDDALRRELADDMAEFLAFHEHEPDPGWADAVFSSRGALRLTPERARAFFEDYLVLLNRYAEPAGQPAGRTVAARLLLFPLPDPDAERAP